MADFRKSVLRSLLPHLILTEAANSPVHGYQIIEHVRKKYGVLFGGSIVYPKLTDLEKQGLIQGVWQFTGDRPRKVYSITNKGRRALDKTTEVLTVLRMGLVNHMVEIRARDLLGC